jgi:DNA-binding HxlR family transcriptional regulator
MAGISVPKICGSGVGTNVLAGRLADLQRAGLVTKRELPPPTAVTVYELTAADHPGRSGVIRGAQ